MIRQTEINEVIFVWLMGGLGNVLFQINYGMHLEQRGYKVRFVVNLTHSNWVTKILGWHIHNTVYQHLVLAEFTQQRWTPLILARIGLTKKLSRFYGKGHVPERPALHCFGYFQEKALLRKILIRLKPSPVAVSVTSNPVMHLRLKDSNYAKGNIENLQVFKKWMPRKRFVIITDDPEKAQKLIGDIKLDAVIQHNDVITDFQLLTSAKTLLLTDSTFSWWAAALSTVLYEVWIPTRLFDDLGFPDSFKVIQKMAGLVQLKRIT